MSRNPNCETTAREIAERFRENSEVFDAVEHWAKRAQVSAHPDKVDIDLLDRLKHLLNWYKTTPVECEEEGLNGDGAA